jgi:hypothetical protein
VNSSRLLTAFELLEPGVASVSESGAPLASELIRHRAFVNATKDPSSKYFVLSKIRPIEADIKVIWSASAVALAAAWASE